MASCSQVCLPDRIWELNLALGEASLLTRCFYIHQRRRKTVWRTILYCKEEVSLCQGQVLREPQRWELSFWTCLSFYLKEAQSDHGFFFFFVFCLFRAAPTAYGGSHARGLMGATAASLRHSHSNARSKLHLRPTPQFMATTDSEPTERAKGSNLQPHGS